jgi:hypothetical protein
MKKTASRILKADDVVFEGQFRLDVTKNEPSMPQGKTMAAMPPSANIIESNSEFAVIEITCSCGRKTRLRCEYTPK